MTEYKLWIGGKWIKPESGRTFPTYNPATGEIIAQIPLAGQPEVDLAVESARQAFPIWSQKMQMERSQILQKIAGAIRKHAEEITKLEILEHGSVLETANRIPMQAAGEFETSAVVSRSLIDDFVPSIPHMLTYIKREPIGVAGIITPWNHSMLMMAVKLAQALSVGNACIVKPPSVNSLMGLKLAEILHEVTELPPGVVNIITGPGSVTGNMIANHPGIDVIGFTGSSATGKELMAAASKTLKRLTMELGGKNPFIVLKDADLDEIVPQFARQKCDNTGQHCSGAGRYYVHKDLYNKFIDRYVAEMKKIVVGDPADNKTMMGPMASQENRDRIEGYLETGVREGARLLLGGTRPTTPPLDKGWFVMPAVLADVKQNVTVAREEIFGPVAVIMEPFTSEDEVVKLANDNVYGLVASVWTRDVARGMTFINRLHAGTVQVNNSMLGPGMPWGGFKESGIGKESGLEGTRCYTQLKAVAIKFGEIRFPR